MFEAKSYTVTASSDHINGTRHGTFVVEALPVDKPVLNTLYEATGVDNWEDNTNWLSHAPIDDWHGVDTDTGSDGRVTVLELPSNSLSGAIPTVVGDLTGLEVLDLSRNGLTGEIPAALESLAALGTLDLSGNGLTGEIPSDLGDLTALTSLDLSANNLGGGIPSDLGKLTNLQVLYLASNNLDRPIPAELGNLTNLTELDLSGNRLSGWIPAQLDKLANLQVLDLSGNRLIGAIPEGLGNLQHLDAVYLSENRLDSGCIPASWRDLRNHDLDDIDLPFCDVALSALVVSPGELTPRFDPGVSEYTAEVEDGQVTITPATSYGGAFQLLDSEGESVPDADGALGGHQIAVGSGDTTIEIRVVSPDGGDRHTYTVRVVWAGEPRVPAIAAITPGASSLEVSWGMPTDIRDDYITSYDLRHIQSSAPDKADSNWTMLDVRSAEAHREGTARRHWVRRAAAGGDQRRGQPMVRDRQRDSDGGRVLDGGRGIRCGQQPGPGGRLRGAAGGAGHPGRYREPQLVAGYPDHGVGRRHRRRNAAARYRVGARPRAVVRVDTARAGQPAQSAVAAALGEPVDRVHSPRVAGRGV